jgi:hypothetical protein
MAFAGFATCFDRILEGLVVNPVASSTAAQLEEHWLGERETELKDTLQVCKRS